MRLTQKEIDQILRNREAVSDGTVRAIEAAVHAKLRGAGEPCGVAGKMPGTPGFTMAAFKSEDVPVATKLYTAPQPSAEEIRNQALEDAAKLINSEDFYPANLAYRILQLKSNSAEVKK